MTELESIEMAEQDLMDKIVSLCKRRGFVFPGSEIYGGLANSYEYGPAGVELKKNISDSWWQTFVRSRTDMVGLDSSIILHPKVWEASGHVASFADSMIDCKNCKLRTRADHLIEDYYKAKDEEILVEGKTEEEMSRIVQENKIACPNCKKFEWTAVRKFNLLFETSIGIVPEDQSKAYLRGETAQGIFIAFKNITDSTRVRLPFRVGQIGKSFRNEITKGNFIFRTLEFEQAEIEYFFNPEKSDWNQLFEQWKLDMWNFVTKQLGIKEDKLRWREHGDEERSFYSKRTEDLEYEYPFGFKELWGLAYRTDYDLQQHAKFSGQDLSMIDPETNTKVLPHVIEPAVGINRLMAMVLLDAYREEGDTDEKRIYLALSPRLAPFKAAVFPLMANKPELVEKAKAIYNDLKQDFTIAWDDRGNVGKRYYSQDEIGTPYCITVDFDTLDNDTVTIRDRDTATQERIAISELASFIREKIK